MENKRLSDAEIIKHYLTFALTNANSREKTEIKAHLDILEFDQSPETVNLCDHFRQKIHHLITGQRQLELDFKPSKLPTYRPPVDLLPYLERVDHALQSMDTGDALRLAEIKNLQTPIKVAIHGILEGDPDAEKFAQKMIVAIRERVDALAVNPESAGYHEIHRK